MVEVVDNKQLLEGFNSPLLLAAPEAEATQSAPDRQPAKRTPKVAGKKSRK
jgi:hypothetical protein